MSTDFGNGTFDRRVKLQVTICASDSEKSRFNPGHPFLAHYSRGEIVETKKKARAMIKELQVTLYDCFGYLFPGIPVVLGVGLIFLAFYIPPPLQVAQSSPPTVSILNEMPSIAGWLLLALLAYFAGHVGQAVGNMLPARAEDVIVNNIKGKGLRTGGAG